MAADDLRVRAILAELPMSDDGTGHVADCGYDEAGPACGCASLPSRIRAVLVDAHPTPSEPEATVVEEWQTVPSDWTSLASHVRGHRSRREAEAVRGVSTGERKLMRRTRTIYADRVTEWTEETD